MRAGTGAGKAAIRPRAPSDGVFGRNSTALRASRCAGAYSVRRRARWRKLGIHAESRLRAETPSSGRDTVPLSPALRALRRRWEDLLLRIFEVDPLRCRRCGAEMRILAFILDPEVTAAMLRHLRRHGRNPYAMHDELLDPPARPPP